MLKKIAHNLKQVCFVTPVEYIYYKLYMLHHQVWFCQSICLSDNVNIIPFLQLKS